MFAIDDLAVWFAWYFVSDLAMHPATHRAAERAHAAVVGDAPAPPQTDDPNRLLDWVLEGRVPPPALSGQSPPTAGPPRK